MPGYANVVVGDLLSEVYHLDERIRQYDLRVRTMGKDCTAVKQLMQLMGVGGDHGHRHGGDGGQCPRV